MKQSTAPTPRNSFFALMSPKYFVLLLCLAVVVGMAVGGRSVYSTSRAAAALGKKLRGIEKALFVDRVVSPQQQPKTASATSPIVPLANPTNCTAGTTTSASCLNNTSITANAKSQGVPYASTINVSGMNGNVTNVTLVLHGVTSVNNLAEVQLLLLAPNGTKLVFLTGDAVGDGGSPVPTTITINDASASVPCNGSVGIPASLPATACGSIEHDVINGFPASGALTGCTISPLTCPLAKPLGSGPAATMATFNSEPSGNGNWSLFTVNNGGVRSDAAAYSFTGGWTINITTSGVAAAATTTSVSPANTSVSRTPPSASSPATITATVDTSPHSTINGGTVSFFDNGNAVSCNAGSNTTVANNTATCILTFTQEGIHPITATYNGASGFTTSSSPAGTPANVTVTNTTTVSNVTTTTGTYCNVGSILIPASGITAAPAAPYPSQVIVPASGGNSLPGVITNLTVDLKQIHHTNPNASQLLLVSPNNTAYILLSDAYTSGGAQGPANITLSDAGATQIPNSGGFSSGTFRPADYHTNASEDEGVFPAPAPQSGFLFPNPIGSGLPAGPSTIGQAFNGAGATGAWQLYVFQNSTGSSGAIDNGWCVNFTVNPNEHATTTSASASPVSSYTTSPFTSKFPPAPANDFVTFTAHITSNISVTTGSVTFTENGSNITCGNGTTNPAPVNGSGDATCNTTFTTEGNHIIKATYHDAGGTFGDSNGNTLERVDSHSTASVNGTTYTYCNPGQIRVPAFSVAAGPGNPYPSNIFVHDLPGTIMKVTVSIPDLSANNAAMRYLTSLLVGPNQVSTDSLDLFSHVGQLSGFASPIDITLDDAAGSQFTQSADPTSGTWRPTSFNLPSAATYPSLSPAGPYPPPPGTPQYAAPTGTSTFALVYGSGLSNTRIGNGTWSLFQQVILNTNPFFEGDGSSQPGWCVNLTENPVTVTANKSHTSSRPNGHFQQGQQSGASFSFAITNNGVTGTGLGSTGDPDGLHPLTVVDVLDAAFTPGTLPTGSPWNCTVVANTVTCKSSLSIASGSSYPTLTIPVIVKNNASASANNQASLSGGGITATNSNADTVTIDPAPILAIAKAHSGTFTQGSTATWTLQVTNNASSAAGTTDGSTVTVSDTLPTGYTLSSFTGTNWNCTSVTNVVTCTSTDVVNGSGGLFPLITLTVNVPANSPVSVSNQGKVFGGGDVTHTNLGSAAVSTIDPVTVIQVPKTISINGTATQSALINTSFGSLAVTVTDAGNVVIPNYSSVVFTASTGGSGQSGTFDNATNTKSVTTGTGGSSGIADPGTFTANGTAGAYTVDVAAGPATHATFNLTNTAPDLTLSKVHNGTFKQGDTGKTYTITVTNSGTASSSGQITVLDTLPTDLTPTNATGPGWTCPITNQLVSCTNSNVIAPNGTSAITLTVNVSPTAAASVQNTATVSGGGEVVTNNDSSTDTVSVTQLADLTIVKLHNGTFKQGDTGDTYTITVTNSGTGSSNGTITVLDTLPSGLTPTNATGTGWTCPIINQAVSCTNSNVIAPNGTSAITLTVNVATNAASSIQNTATVSGGGEVVTNNDSSTDTVAVTQLPDLTISKANNVSGASPGTPWNWTLTVANVGLANATFTDQQVILTDPLPSTNLGYSNVTPAAVSGITNFGNISCSILSNTLSCKANGATVTIAAPGSFTVQFTATPTAAGTFTNPNGTCSVDPNNNVAESVENNNNSNTDSVTATASTVVYAQQAPGNCGGNTPCFSSLQAAINFASATVNVVGGTFNESVNLNKNITVNINGPTMINDLTFSNGTINGGSATLTLGSGNWTNNGGSFNPGTGAVVFAGSGQTIGGTSPTTFNGLTIGSGGTILNAARGDLEMWVRAIAPAVASVDATVNGQLVLNGDLNTGTNTLIQPDTAPASTGTGDVVGKVKRTGAPLASLALTYGNPNNLITLNAGNSLTSINVKLTKTVPTDAATGLTGTGFPGAVQRTYVITPAGGTFTSATLQLHYLDAELNSNDENTMTLWRFNSVSGLWEDQGADSPRDTTNNWVQKTGVTQFSPWTLSSVTPTATNGNVSGQITDSNGIPVEGAGVRMGGTQNRLTVTDANGFYHFDNVETNGFYTVVPSRPNFSFSPSQRAFSQLGQHTEAAFSASSSGGGLNPLDTTEYFVRQQYVDFLNREPDEAGFNFWVNNIENCGNDASCRAAKRTDTSAAFFLSTEFQQTGYLVYRTYQAAFGDLPGAPVPLRLGEFKPDAAEIGNGVIVNQSGWETALENNKQAFAGEFVQRARFASAYPTTMTPSEFVDKLFANAGVAPSDTDRSSAISEFGSASTSADPAARGRALRRVAENSVLAQQEFNQAFVAMEYFGYLRRDANTGPDTDFSGYDFWMNKLNTFGGNYQNAEMVKSFLLSGEYRGRFPR